MPESKHPLPGKQHSTLEFHGCFLPSGFRLGSSFSAFQPIPVSRNWQASVYGRVYHYGQRVNTAFFPSLWKSVLLLTYQLCCPGNVVKVECQLCYQAILLIVKMTQLLNCFWCCRIVNESKYLAGSHSFGLPWLWNSWYTYHPYGAPGNYSLQNTPSCGIWGF